MPAVLKKASEPIPGYKLVQRIGAGGYGEVWTAEAPGELVKAIKFVYGLLDEDRATREMKALHRIKGVRHPFLLSLERIEVVDGQLIIVTELADSSLKDRFDQCRKEGQPGIPRDELLQHLRDAADALDYMSEQHSLQHLDVKPENLLLVGGRIKVADFGLVKDMHDGRASMMGGLTPIYAPPEVFEGRPTKRSDQYSLAIVYQEMLTGVLPFPGKTAAQLAAQHLERPAANGFAARSRSAGHWQEPLARIRTSDLRIAANWSPRLNKATQADCGRADDAESRRRHRRSSAVHVHARRNAGEHRRHRLQPSQPPNSHRRHSRMPPKLYRTPDQMLANLDEASQAADSLQEAVRLWFVDCR